MKSDKIIAIIGLGYVGLPLAIEFGKLYQTIGFDIDKNRIKELLEHKDKNDQVLNTDFQASNHLYFTHKHHEIQKADIYIITVPTPVDKYKTPDISALLQASKIVGEGLKKGNIVIYESTTYPTCTQQNCVPVLETSSNLIYNKDFFVGYSPERINPGDKQNTLTNIKKITSGSTKKIAEEIDALYSSIITAGTYLAPSIEVAEAAKAIENAQRDLNIAFVNELAMIFDKLGIDTYEVLQAASSKWNFLKFTPGLVGGHCIGVDPYYLTHIASKMGYHPKVISAGRQINDAMPVFIAQKMIKLLAKNYLEILNAKILLLGITFKENCKDTRNSKVPQVAKELLDFGCDVHICDPIADKAEVKKTYQIDIFDLPETFKNAQETKYDGIILCVAHQEFKNISLPLLVHKNSVIYDLKGFLETKSSENITRL
ncbi:nucleotide sugar dehydrogenase [Helicobacter cappadocius]|uniref:Nucleotide sugar dehydrogenase n=1 Tax=Helicobacter cappadocius TaxID=3063998 RepID=A0AA90T9B4_9HELI|nr:MULTISPECIES: nucleotide sugar dehydrogenase [unclassified Helicobacter]MDO7253807.1 nucleotide sugar dehydrogenase [Helicobacter sp. faydin-H75]MDP2538687.1 nucleotide sugar dehydrogenase [Helicobacter sp. faydin-H76]